ncbi:MAG TPA: type II toxin-antitoxin system VapC family toxin [Pyrinomonadaceae bacterium]|nr:type II toxin-antitoxin system VapC family toxin [Pyrinomonadaceae bacterium]
MITALDTNILIALWDRDDVLNSAALTALDDAFARGSLVLCGAVFAELMAFPKRTDEFLTKFLNDTEIVVDWKTDEAAWRTAGRAFRAHADRRRKQRSDGPRRILADFFIGAHALENGYSLLTLDDGIYRAAFPKLRIFRV